MLFETSNIKPGNVTGKPPNKPVQPVRTAASTIKKQPVATNITTARPVTNFTRPVTQPKQQVPKTFTQQSVRKPLVSTTVIPTKPAKTFANKAFVKPGQKPVSGWTYYRQGVKKPLVSTTIVPAKQGRVYAAGVAAKPGQKHFNGWAYYRQGINRYGSPYNARYVQRPPYTSTVAAPNQASNIITGWAYNRPGVYVAPPASQGYPTSQAVPQTAAAQQVTQPPQPHVCHSCGSGVRGCTTLPAFTFNSWQLRLHHKKLIHALAIKILRKGINLVIATGHTDSSGTEDYNQALGEKRAATVITELKKQLSRLRPNAHRNLLYKTDSRGESQPVSQGNAAANRRVEICVRRVRF